LGCGAREPDLDRAIKGLGLRILTLDKTGVQENRRFHIVDSYGRRYNQIRNGALKQTGASSSSLVR
jgi:uncharacterized protein YcbX